MAQFKLFYGSCLHAMYEDAPPADWFWILERRVACFRTLDAARGLMGDVLWRKWTQDLVLYFDKDLDRLEYCQQRMPVAIKEDFMRVGKLCQEDIASLLLPPHMLAPLGLRPRSAVESRAEWVLLLKQFVHKAVFRMVEMMAMSDACRDFLLDDISQGEDQKLPIVLLRAAHMSVIMDEEDLACSPGPHL